MTPPKFQKLLPYSLKQPKELAPLRPQPMKAEKQILSQLPLIKTDLNVVPESESPEKALAQSKNDAVKNNLSGEQMLNILGKKVKKRVLTRQNAIEVSQEKKIVQDDNEDSSDDNKSNNSDDTFEDKKDKKPRPSLLKSQISGE